MSNKLSFASAGTILCVIAVLIIACMLCCSPCITCCSYCCEGLIKSLSCCCKLICFTKKIVEVERNKKRPEKEAKKGKKLELSDTYLCNSPIDDELELKDYKTPPKRRKTVRFVTEEGGPWIVETLENKPTLIKKINGKIYTYNMSDMTVRDEVGQITNSIQIPDFRKTLELRLKGEFRVTRQKSNKI